MDLNGLGKVSTVLGGLFMDLEGTSVGSDGFVRICNDLKCFEWI